MPHDLNGAVLTVGDIVTMKFRVTQVNSNEDYCNVHITSVLPLYPHQDQFSSLSAVNTKQVEKV